MQAINNRAISMGCTLLKGTQKEGQLTPDDDGYYTVVLGAYGAYNSGGMFYDLPSAAALFQRSSQLMRQIEKGVLRGEQKHPTPKPDDNQQSYIARIRSFDEDREAFHIRRVYLQDGHKDEQGRPITVVIGEIRPSGPFGQSLKEKLDNPHENVYFSVRSLTMDDIRAGVKYTKEIITWDYVNEGGIYNASKYHSPSLESFEEVEVTPTTLWALADEQKHQMAMGFESSETDYNALAAALGWSKSAPSKPKTPAYLDW